MKRLLLITVLATLFFGCSGDNTEVLNRPKYTGPINEGYDVTTLYSDSAVVKLKFEAPVVHDFENGDGEYPEGIYLEFYDKEGEMTNTLRADYCYFYSDKNEYKASGDVVMRSIKEKQQLNTEELFWNQKEEKVYTDKFVRIETEDQITMGEGLEAAQDFSWYTIKDSRGTISLDSQ